MRYGEYLAQGFPIATGVIEGACRHLVEDRMGITGARWDVPGAEAVVRLRAIRCSGDWDEYWKFHEQQELERNHGPMACVIDRAGRAAPHIPSESALGNPHTHLISAVGGAYPHRLFATNFRRPKKQVFESGQIYRRMVEVVSSGKHSNQCWADNHYQ